MSRNPHYFSGRKIAIIGAGKSGLASATVLQTLGAKPYVLDDKEDSLSALQDAFHPGLLTRGQERQILDEIDPDLVVVSPGVPPVHPSYQWCGEKSVPMWSEVELAWQVQQNCTDYPDLPWLTITGTNGKTTTVGMTESIMRASGKRVEAVGNVGTPVVGVVADGKLDALVVELSSFQLHNIYSVSALASICLNIAPDHIDWHGSFQAYRDAKARVYERTQKACIFNRMVPETIKMVEEAEVVEGARAIGIGIDQPAVSQFGLVEDLLIDRAFLPTRHKEAIEVATFDDLKHLSGEHPNVPLLTDALAAAALTRAAGVAPSDVAQGLRDFRPAAHRRAIVGTRAQLTWIDDSKATNAHATAASLAGMPEKSVIWIAGGDAKGQDFTDLVAQVKPVLRAVIVIGKDHTPFLNALAKSAPEVPYIAVPDQENLMESVVHEAIAHSVPGNFVVLAPACASWDQFNNYGERGDAFTQAVLALEERS